METKKCRLCGRINEGDHTFCGNCGSPLDSNVSLVMEMNKSIKDMKSNKPIKPARVTTERRYSQKDDDEDEGGVSKGMIIAGVVVGVLVAAACVFLLD